MPQIVTELHEMELRTWVALGAKLNDQGTVVPIGWKEWCRYRDELDELEKKNGK